jgi:hypothetical protein
MLISAEHIAASARHAQSDSMSPRSRPNDNYGINNQGVNEAVDELLWLSQIEQNGAMQNGT